MNKRGFAFDKIPKREEGDNPCNSDTGQQVLFFFLLTEHLMELLELSHIRGEVTQTGFPFWGSAWEGQMTHHIVDGRGVDPGSILEHRLIRGEKE